MLAGPSGTGKTQIINGMLQEFDPVEMMSATINFNFYTTSAVLMTTMGIPLVKKTGNVIIMLLSRTYPYYYI